ncbi:BEACH domain-containing protein B [Citrus sinensis]|nr:BEACH domain-containing protein B [Citrus sinensis]
MNIVKGVADLIRRTSSGSSGDSSSGVQHEKFSPPSQKICFSGEGDEAVLNTLWERYESTTDKVEKRKLFHVFLKQFLIVFRNWEPVNGGLLPEPSSTSIRSTEYLPHFDDIVVGCFAGHPAEIIILLIEEVTHLTTYVTEVNTNVVRSTMSLSESSTGLSSSSEAFSVLDALTIVTRSMHNCRVFGYYGGIQKLTALMKGVGVVIQLKTIAGAVSVDESFSNFTTERIGFLQQILVYVVSIMCSFIDLSLKVNENYLLYSSTTEFSVQMDGASQTDSSSSLKAPFCETRLNWHKKAVVSVMEAGGVNWLVELLRVIRRLGMKEQWTDTSVQCLTLRTLRLVLSDNPRGQNHFKSIGGLEVLLDGLGFPYTNVLLLKNEAHIDAKRFGNVNNLQFLCEDGRVHKFSNSFCSPAFMLQEYKQQRKNLDVQDDFQVSVFDLKNVKRRITEPTVPLSDNASYSQLWSDYVVKLSRVLCTFLLAPEDFKSVQGQAATSRVAIPVSSLYGELSLKWVMRVLLTVFPCIKACSNDNELPSHLRVFVATLQHCVLYAFRKVLVSSPVSLNELREQGMWDLIFSENFFYFEPTLEVFSEECCSLDEGYAPSNSTYSHIRSNGVEVLQMDVISFVEFAATSIGNVHNLVDALEQSACNPEIAILLAKSLRRILQLSAEKTIASFKTLDAVPRVLKVACIQAQESKRLGSLSPSIHGYQRYDSRGTAQVWHQCVEMCMELFMEFCSIADDARSLVLRNSTCIDCLFDLFWEEGFRNNVQTYILDLMKYYQALFRDGECFLHVLSLLNGNFDEANGEKLVLNVLQTLTCLLASNDASKAAFRALVGKGYQTLQNLLLGFCQWHPSEGLLNALLDMLVDGKFESKGNPLIQNEDVIILYLTVLQKSSDSLRHYGLNVFQLLVRDSLSNQASCVRAGMLHFLLDWFSQEDNDSVILQMAQLIEVIGGHSVSGKDIRKIFALLRSEKVGKHQQYCSLLLSSISSMLNVKGPTAFFDLNGSDSAVNLKRQCVQLPVNLIRKKWHFLCITHSIGRAFSGGSLLRCYVDGDLVSSERCSYAKVSEVLTSCSIGTKIKMQQNEGDNVLERIQDCFPFLGQIGPIYLFNDAISSEQVKGVHSLGPSYMYSFLDNEAAPSYDNQLPSGILDAKDGLASKIIFGLNAQASSGKKLFNVSPMLDLASDKNSFEANVMIGTQLCSRRLLQQIIYCVGGVSVFFPLIAQSDRYENEESGVFVHALHMPIPKERLTAEVIGLIASVLDENLSNQQQMHLLSGFSVLGFLLQSVPPQQLNLESLSALKHLFNVIANSGLAELLVKDAISSIFLNPLIWLYTAYKVQRELYMFLIQQFDNDPRLHRSLCRLPRVIDIIRQFYWDNAKSRSVVGSKPLLHPITKQVIGERPCREEIRKIRLLLLSLGEMSLRDYEPIRLLGLQFLGKLLVGLPSEKKGPRFFSLAVGRSKSLSEIHKKIDLRMQPVFSAMSDWLFRFPQTDNLCAALFDVLLGGASPKQVLQKNNQVDKHRNKGNNSHFFLPQTLVLIFRFLAGCEEAFARMKIISDLLDLLDSNPSNIEALMEYGWNAWLTAAVKLDVLKGYKPESRDQGDHEMNEQTFVRSLFCVVLCHYMHSVKGGWQQLEETVNFLLMHSEKEGISYRYFLRDMYEDLIRRLVDLSSEENIFVSQPCRDNTLYLLRLVDEMLVSEIDHKIPFPADSSGSYLGSLELESHKDYCCALYEVLQGDVDGQIPRDQWVCRQIPSEGGIVDDKWWNIYDNLWVIISAMNGKGPSKLLPKSSSSGAPSFGQRARGLVESLNIPAAEMAAVVVSGGIGSALGGKPNKNVDKAMLLRGERCPRIVFRLIILYLCQASLERASRCVQQVIPLLPSLLPADDEYSKGRLQLFIWALLAVRSQYGTLDDGTRFHVIAHLIRETVNCGKSMLANSIIGRNDSEPSSNSKETGSIHNLIQKDRVLMAVSDEAKYIKTTKLDRSRQLVDLRARMDESYLVERSTTKAFEDEIQSILSIVLASDENRRATFQLTHGEQQQNVAEKWIHMFRALIDERGPWSADPFPTRSVIHWKLDKTEDAWRRRQKLRKNYHFDEKLCHPPSTAPSDEAILPANENKSSFVGHIPEQMKQFLLKGIRRIADEGTSEPSESDTEPTGQMASITEEISDSQLLEHSKTSSDPTDVVERKDSSSSSSEMETSEVILSVPCLLVTPKRKLAGHLAVMKDVLHFFGEFVVEGTGGSSALKNFSVTSSSDLNKPHQRQKFLKWPEYFDLNSEKEVPETAEAENLHKKQLKNVKRHRRWNVGKISTVHWTRYLLRYTAIEVFFCDSVGPVFLNFTSQKVAKEVGTLIVAIRNEFLFPKGSSRDKSGAISFVDRRIAQEMAETARERWRRRDITNFEYLMILNTLAGRSYNDLTQYPVFPWVLADYSSEVLDFNKSTTFRDLSKPVGALDPKRFEVFEDRYRNFCDPDIPSFYYGSHYSSMGIVLYYLLRLEPFTSLHRNLQGGKFDHADRLFQSIEGTYRNCLSNTSDVKELIPEFFYLPEFLVNSNSYHLGVKQDGEPIGDVSLPPWAKDSPEVFINKNREALESEYVSSNLHHWIDLVFGYKQRGKPAVEAANIFYYLTYEGAVDLDAMEDELQKSAIEDQIANFGQTPSQIFRKKHPRRGPPIPIAHPLYFAPGSINLTSIICSTRHQPSGIVYVGMLDSSIVLVNQGLTLSVKMWLTTQLQSGGNFTFSGSQDPFFGVGADILSPRNVGSPLAESFELGSQCFTTMQTPSENFLITCGNWENSFQVIALNDGRVVQSIRQHRDVVSCVAVTTDGSILATGSYDTTVMVWEVIRARAPEKRVRNMQIEVPRKDYVIVETPFHILCGHDDIITCLYVSVELDIVISGSKDGTCVFHTLREGRYVRSLCHPSGSALSKLAASRHGRIVLYGDDDLSLHLFSINGKHLASSESNGRLNCLELSACGQFLVCGGDQGQIVVRSMNSLEVVRRYSGVGKIITSLAVTPEECFLAGTKDGCLLVYSIENRRTSLPRNVKSKASITG